MVFVMENPMKKKKNDDWGYPYFRKPPFDQLIGSVTNSNFNIFNFLDVKSLEIIHDMIPIKPVV